MQPQNQTDDFKIEGGHTLSGTVITNTSKNGAMGLFAASLVNRGTTTLHGIPRIEEVYRFIEIFKSLHIAVEWTDKHSVRIVPPKTLSYKTIDKHATEKIRSALMLIGPLSGRVDKFDLPHTGGCKMGERTVAAHKYALEELGLSIKTLEHCYRIESTKHAKKETTMYEASDTGTINAILRAAVMNQTTIIDFAQQNYMVLEVCYFLQNLGITIDGMGTKTLTITGNKNVNTQVEYTNSEDPIESMFFISAAIVTNSTLTITRAPIDFLKLELFKLQKMGLKCTISKPYLAINERTKLVDITVKPSKLVAPHDKLHAQPYPGINTDNLPFFVPIATQAKGTTMIHDWMWENRAIFFTELNKLGANIRLADQHRVFIEGPTKLTGAEIECPPALRPAVMILIAMLGAKGTSILRNVYAINRGYEHIVTRLNAIGAKIKLL